MKSQNGMLEEKGVMTCSPGWRWVPRMGVEL